MSTKLVPESNRTSGMSPIQEHCGKEGRGSSLMSVKEFNICGYISHGAFGTVYLCRRVGRPSEGVMAMKIVRKMDIIYKNKLNSVYGERDILSSVSCPFVMSLNNFCQTNNYVCFVMEFMVGGDLKNMIQTLRSFNEYMAAFYIAECALALDYLHRQCIIHRDIKPDNMLISKYGHLKLTDFGLSETTNLVRLSVAKEVLTPRGHRTVVRTPRLLRSLSSRINFNNVSAMDTREEHRIFHRACSQTYNPDQHYLDNDEPTEICSDDGNEDHDNQSLYFSNCSNTDVTIVPSLSDATIGPTIWTPDITCQEVITSVDTIAQPASGSTTLGGHMLSCEFSDSFSATLKEANNRHIQSSFQSRSGKKPCVWDTEYTSSDSKENFLSSGTRLSHNVLTCCAVKRKRTLDNDSKQECSKSSFSLVFGNNARNPGCRRIVKSNSGDPYNERDVDFGNNKKLTASPTSVIHALTPNADIIPVVNIRSSSDCGANDIEEDMKREPRPHHKYLLTEEQKSILQNYKFQLGGTLYMPSAVEGSKYPCRQRSLRLTHRRAQYAVSHSPSLCLPSSSAAVTTATDAVAGNKPGTKYVNIKTVEYNESELLNVRDKTYFAQSFIENNANPCVVAASDTQFGGGGGKFVRKPCGNWDADNNTLLTVPPMRGTPDYFAPELIATSNSARYSSAYTRAVDWWALGCCLFEFIYGCPPFWDESVSDIFENIINHRIEYDNENIPERINIAIERLLAKCSYQRAELAELRQMAMFKCIDFDRIQEMQPPYVPNNLTEDDLSNFKLVNMARKAPPTDKTNLDTNWGKGSRKRPRKG